MIEYEKAQLYKNNELVATLHLRVDFLSKIIIENGTMTVEATIDNINGDENVVYKGITEINIK